MQQLYFNGIVIPAFGVLALFSLIISLIAGKYLAKADFYRLVWHRPLFNLAFYIILLGTSSMLYNRYVQ